MSLDLAIRFPNGFTFDLDHLIDHCLGDPDSHLIILGLVVVIDNQQVLMNHQQYLIEL